MRRGLPGEGHAAIRGETTAAASVLGGRDGGSGREEGGGDELYGLCVQRRMREGGVRAGQLPRQCEFVLVLVRLLLVDIRGGIMTDE